MTVGDDFIVFAEKVAEVVGDGTIGTAGTVLKDFFYGFLCQF